MKKKPLTLAERIQKKKQTIAAARKALSGLNVSERKATSRRDRRKKMLLGEALLVVLSDPESQGSHLNLEERLIAEMSENDGNWYIQNRGVEKAETPPLPQTPPSPTPAHQENDATSSQN